MSLATVRNRCPVKKRSSARWVEPLEARQLLSSSIVSGQTISASITQVGEIDVYTFSASAGNTFEVSVGDTTAASGYHSDLVVYSPSGQEVTSAATYDTDSSARAIYTVPAGGGGNVQRRCRRHLHQRDRSVLAGAD